MQAYKVWALFVVVGFGLISVGPAVAAEHGGTTVEATKEHGGSSAAPAQPAAPASAPAPAAPQAPRPIVIKFSGEVVQINRQDPGQPVLTVRDRYGVTKEMMVDSASVKVARGTASVPLEDMKPGDQISAEYTYDVTTYKRSVQTITIAEASAPAASTTP